MEGFVKDIQIAGIASCVPQNTEDNMDYGNVLGERRAKGLRSCYLRSK